MGLFKFIDNLGARACEKNVVMEILLMPDWDRYFKGSMPADVHRTLREYQLDVQVYAMIDVGYRQGIPNTTLAEIILGTLVDLKCGVLT